MQGKGWYEWNLKNALKCTELGNSEAESAKEWTQRSKLDVIGNQSYERVKIALHTAHQIQTRQKLSDCF